jgi:hypothetical protein
MTSTLIAVSNSQPTTLEPHRSGYGARCEAVGTELCRPSAEHIVALKAFGERRFYPRIFPPVLIYVPFGPNNLGKVVNISENGLRVSTPRGLDLNSVYRVSLCLNGLPNAIRVHVRTVWTTESQKRAGIQLLDLSEHDREQIRRWGALQPSRNETLERWFLPENAEPLPETTEPQLVLAESTKKPERDPAIVVSSPPFKGVRADTPPNDEFPVARNAVAPRTRTRSSTPVLIVWSAFMAGICLATAWSFRHNLSDRLLNRPVRYTKEYAPSVGHSPSLVALHTPVTLAPSRIPTPKNASPNTVAAKAVSKSFPSNIPVTKGLDGKAPAAKPNLSTSPTHATELVETPTAPDSDVADSVSDPFPTNVAIPGTATPNPTETHPFSNVSAINNSTTKTLSRDTAPSKSAITGSIANPTRSSGLPTSTPSDTASIPAPPPAFPSPSTAGSTTYVERKSDSAVIHMDVPEARVMELTPSSSRTASFVVLPGERVFKSASVTMHIQRSVWVHGDHWLWHSHKKVALGELTSRVDPQISHFATTSGTITVQATIDKDGRVSNLKPLNGSFALLPSVARAIREWRYEPTYLDNKPVETQALVEVDFHPRHPRLQTLTQSM